MAEPEDPKEPKGSVEAESAATAASFSDEDDHLALEPEIACNLLSDHGGEIVITDDGRVVFMNASEHLVDLAHALDPENPDVQERKRKVEEVRAARAAAAEES
ncbi:MAG: hypothetical protein ACYTFT_12250 [Planctomycetota bacterium]|jgi:hypothetical protein